jgi:hypothetical protein
MVTGTPSDSGAFGARARVTSGAQTADRIFTLTIDGVRLWEWTEVTTPLEPFQTGWVRVDPGDDDTWYVGGFGGLFVTYDAGQTWTQKPGGVCLEPVEFAHGDPSTVYAVDISGSDNVFSSTLERSTDRGHTWQKVFEVPTGFVSSLHVGRHLPGLVLIGARIDPRVDPVPDRFYRSSDHGATWSTQILDGGSRGLIPWDIEEDVNGVLYSGTEIYDHPQPYRPPFFRSLDGGLTWEDVAGTLPWHVISIQAHPSNPTVYALTEGAGLYLTTDAGASWTRVSSGPLTPSYTLLVDPLIPSRMYGGRISGGGVLASSDGGQTFHFVGFGGAVGSLSLAQQSSVLFAAAGTVGIRRAVIPSQW